MQNERDPSRSIENFHRASPLRPLAKIEIRATPDEEIPVAAQAAANGHDPTGLGLSVGLPPRPQILLLLSPLKLSSLIGSIKPIGLQEMTEEERELFSSDVNSTAKNPQNKDGGHHGGGGPNGRKTSVSHGNAVGYAPTSPTTASRPGARRRETTDANPFSTGALTSPTSAGRFSRDESSPWFSRKNTDVKESVQDEPEDEPANLSARANPPFGPARASTSGSSGFVATSSLWGSPASGPGTLFGHFALPGARPVGGGVAGGSRLAHLMPTNNDGAGSKPGDGPSPDTARPWRTGRQHTDTDPCAGEDKYAGSATLGGAQDSSPQTLPSQLHRPAYDTPAKGSSADFGIPPGDRLAEERDESAVERLTQNDAGGEQPTGFNAMSRPFGTGPFDGSDRSQNSSAGAKNYPSLGSLAGLTGWPAGPSIGTPDRDRHSGFGGAFGGNLFNAVGDLQSPSLGSLSGVFGPASASNLPRGSKLGSLFPPAMQAQMQSHDQDSHGDAVPELRQGQTNPLGAIGRGSIGQQTRETGSPLRTTMRPPFDDAYSPFTTADRQSALTTTSQGTTFASATAGTIPDPTGAQNRVMVMPDRMMWVYLDPQGLVQGPWNGLEMNDWYKANFFSPDLRVKKLEDAEFEPLGQLIRRIGNSREPFLVPQMGIPHGPPNPGPFGVPDSRGGVVPPLQNAFPTFGKTLTAEEQNNLERRKQEEQILMARQRGSVPAELFAPDLTAQERQMLLANMQGGSSALGTYASAHSQASVAPIGTTPADRSGRGQLPPVDQLQQDEQGFKPRLQEFLGLRTQRDGQAEENSRDADQQAADDAVASLVQADAEEMAQKLRDAMDQTHDGTKGSSALAQQSLSLTQLVRKTQADAAAAAAAANSAGFPMPFPPPQPSTPLPAPTAQRVRSNLPSQYDSRSGTGTPDTTSDAAAAAAPAAPPTAPWAGTEAQKGPSLKEIQEAQAKKQAKQEEAAMAARRFALETETASLREREKNAAVAPGLPSTSTWGTGSPVGGASAAGSPWAQTAAIKASAASVASSAANARQRLADIQREEEAKKHRQQQAQAQAQAVLQASSSAASAALGKRYADLASKPTGPPGLGHATAGGVPTVGGGWTTVGSSGKARVPTGPSAQARAGSAANVKPAAPAAKPVAKPATVVAPKDNGSAALDEFNKWLHRELARGLDKLNAAELESFASTLLILPLDSGIIADSVYASSTTMDGRHFGEEFVRRKKLADRGVVEKSTSQDTTKNGSNGNGGWNEVAKKGGNAAPKEDAAAADGSNAAGSSSQFKVVPGRKKGGKK
ncbi:hypothetical protein P8C59_004479 [Phyllachora maydis]|uniref:GYF domain-containing protein n=1 Tax=Phyllachora maydis TaxID=1825666 RepID=A0AAD9I3F6_9PEZI|nr:hypothetical protein P8C59_004479 [Phyllachora maydis]